MMHPLRYSRLFAIPLLSLFTLPFTACGGGSDASGGNDGGSCDSLQVNGGKYPLVFGCDSSNFFGTGEHMCTEYYSNVPSTAATFKTLCSVESGSPVSHCPTAGGLGSCTASATTATGTQGAIEVTYGYLDSQGKGSAAQFQADCGSGSVYAPPGAAPASSAKAGSAVTSTCPSKGASSGVAFSMATLVNGEYLECTNYVGTVNADQLASVLKIGATVDACPEKNALCACTKKKGGTFGTDATMVYYKTSMNSSGGSCDGVGAGCDVYTDSYKAP